MSRPNAISVCALALTLATLPACSRDEPRPPPTARRPVIRSEAELAAERTGRLARGRVVANTSPRMAQPGRGPARSRVPPVPERVGDIQPDILLVNDAVVTAAEVLYALRHGIREARAQQTPAGFEEIIRRRVRTYIRQQIGTLLIYAEAMAALNQQQTEYVETMVQRELDALVALEYGGSTARLGNHLESYGLTLAQYRDSMQQEIVARQYLTERLRPRVQVRRAELLRHYRENIDKYSTPETRELMMIEAPFASFLPAGLEWQTASAAQRARAKLQAVRAIRAAHAKLSDTPFEDVAREFSRGLHAPQGGSWGQIGRPLQPPYERLSKLIFSYSAGQTSEPIETETGWYIVRCGTIDVATETPFTDVQDELRVDLERRLFGDLSTEYVMDLAAKASISSLETFVDVVVRRAADLEVEPPQVAGQTPLP